MTIQTPPPGDMPPEPTPPEPIPPAPPVAPYPPNPPAPAGPMPVMTPPADRRGLAIASLVMGIISLCGSWVYICGGLFGLIAIVLGALGLNSRGRAMAIAGIVLGIVAIFLTLIIRIFLRGAFFNNFWQQFLTNRGF